MLPNLRSVYARAVIPSEVASRLQALNEVLPRLIASTPTSTTERPFPLFALAPGTRASTITERRRRVAVLLGYHPDHLRAMIEVQLVEAVAVLIQSDLLRYQARVKRAVESLEPTEDTPSLEPEHLTHEEELVSRIWQYVYGLSAELIAFTRLDEQEGFQQQAANHRQAALRE